VLRRPVNVLTEINLGAEPSDANAGMDGSNCLRQLGEGNLHLTTLCIGGPRETSGPLRSLALWALVTVTRYGISDAGGAPSCFRGSPG
jgi:hypothetical protein